MRLIKMFGLAAIAAVAAMAFVGATSASALTNTQLCNTHTSLTCGSAATSVHATLAAGTVGTLLSPIIVLCLGVLVESAGQIEDPELGAGLMNAVGPLGNPQPITATALSFTGCGTGDAHNNCTVTVEELPLNDLLKTGLDEGSLEALTGRVRLVCANIGIDCKYDLEGSLFSVAAQHLTANKTPTIELGGKFVCPNEGFLDGLLKTLENRYVLQ